MTNPCEILGVLLNELRLRRKAGARASMLLRFLGQHNIDSTLARQYFQTAFAAKFPAIAMLPRGTDGLPADINVDRTLEPIIERARPDWELAAPYPDFGSRRDREVFRAVARGRKCHLAIRALNPYSGRWMNQKGYRSAPLRLVATSRLKEPNAGLLAADPSDERLIALLATMAPPRSYQEYKADLEASGYEIGGEVDGWVIRGSGGGSFYPGYCLHGVYSWDDRRNAWLPGIAQSIQRELNDRFGEERVRLGPQDVWEFRNDAKCAGPAVGPQIPLLWIEPESAGSVDVIVDFEQLSRNYRFYSLSWPYEKASTAGSAECIGEAR